MFDCAVLLSALVSTYFSNSGPSSFLIRSIPSFCASVRLSASNSIGEIVIVSPIVANCASRAFLKLVWSDFVEIVILYRLYRSQSDFTEELLCRKPIRWICENEF